MVLELIPDYPLSFWMLAAISVVFVGIAKAGFGGGIGILATPLMALVIPVTDAAAILLPLLIVCDIFAVLHYRRRFHKRSVKLLLIGSVGGIAIGAFFFGYFSGNERVLQVGLGALALVFVLFQATRGLILGMLEGRRPHGIEGIALGVISGFTSTLAHAGGPPVTIYLLPQKLERDHFVATTVIFFAAINQIKLIPYVGLGILGVEHFMTVLCLAPLSYVGVKLGIYFNTRFSEVWFNRVVYGVLTHTAVQLILGNSLVRLLVGG